MLDADRRKREVREAAREEEEQKEEQREEGRRAARAAQAAEQAEAAAQTQVQVQAQVQAEAAEAAEAAASAAVEARAAAAAVAEARLVAAEAAVEAVKARAAVEARAAAAAKVAVEAKVEAEVAAEAEVAGGVFRFDTAASVAAPPASLFGGGASRAPPRGPGEGMAAEGRTEGTADGEWTEELEAAVRRQVVSAMDNYPPQESGVLLDALVGAAARGVADGERSLRKLASLTRQMEALEAAAGAAGGEATFLEDEARTLRSQIRMWAKDGEKYVAGSWLNYLNKLTGSL